MSEATRFEVVADERVANHLIALDRGERTRVLDEIERQLTTAPGVRTRNRKPLRIPNALGATWELRCGTRNEVRVFYDLDVDERLVIVLAIGHKIGNRLRVGGEEFEL